MIETPAFIISIHSTRLNRADVTPLESQDSQKSPFFIYSIYGYKNSSLPDVSSWDIWSQVASMRRLERERRGGGRAACQSFVLSSRGGGHWRSTPRFPARQTPAPEHIWMKECRPVAGEAFARALPARRPCELLTRAASSCTALSRGWWAGGGASKVGFVVARKVELITAHDPFVLLHVIRLLSN